MFTQRNAYADILIFLLKGDSRDWWKNNVLSYMFGIPFASVFYTFKTALRKYR